MPASVEALLAGFAGLAGIVALASKRPGIAGTTLGPAWWWALLAAAVWPLVEALGSARLLSPGWLAPLRLAALALSFCPIVAILGAKRPQHTAWSFVVLAMWGILSLPAAEALFLQRGQRLAMGDARGWFLWIIIALGPINFLPTRQWLPALLLCAAHVLGLSEYLPLVRRPLFAGQAIVALWLAAAALWLVRLQPVPGPLLAYDRLWLDFRNTFGLLWALRLQERVNAVAQSNGWPLELAWSGLVDRQTGVPLGEVPPEIETTLRTTLQGLLRRFVSGDWIAARFGQPLD